MILAEEVLRWFADLHVLIKCGLVLAFGWAWIAMEARAAYRRESLGESASRKVVR